MNEKDQASGSTERATPQTEVRGGSQHTPGPWEIRRRAGINGAHIFASSAEVIVARVTHDADKPIDQKEADALLIAAAPDLLDALKGLLISHRGQWWAKANPSEEELDLAGRAIAKAEGR